MTALAPPPLNAFFDNYHHHQHHPPSCPPSPSMQPPPLRQRMSQTYINRAPPIPPSLLDSPYVQSPNSPFRRDHYINPPNPSYATGHDALNLLDTVPMDHSGSKGRRPSLSGTQQEPDDIGLAGTPKAAKSSSINNYRPPRPGMNRGNSWIQQQQQGYGQQPTSQSLPSSQQPQPYLLPSALPPGRAVPLPLSTPYPIPQQHPPSAYPSRSHHPPSASPAGTANRS